MKLQIYHETIDTRFKEYLKAIGKDEFNRLFDFDKRFSSHEFYIDYYFNIKDGCFDFVFPNVKNAEYRLEVQFLVECKTWYETVGKNEVLKVEFEFTKDREFYMLNLKTNKVLACNSEYHDFSIVSNNANYNGLNYECNKWYENEDKDN